MHAKTIDNLQGLKLLLCEEKGHRILDSLPSGKDVLKNTVLLVNMEKVINDWQDDHRWKPTRGAKDKRYIVTKMDGGITLKPAPHSTTFKHVYAVKRQRFIHDTAKDFHKLILTVTQPSGRTQPVALVQYHFDGEPHQAIQNRPHGNSKTGIPFVPTKRSTIKKLTGEVQKKRSVKRAIFNVEDSQDGIMAKSQSSLPRNERQGKYLKSKINPKSPDPLSSLLQLQHEETEKYIQSITIEGNEPTIILFNKEQINHLEKFCTNEEGQNSPFSDLQHG